MMTRLELLQRLKTAAAKSGVEFEFARSGLHHDLYLYDGRPVVIRRVRTIIGNAAEQILRRLGVSA